MPRIEGLFALVLGPLDGLLDEGLDLGLEGLVELRVNPHLGGVYALTASLTLDLTIISTISTHLLICTASGGCGLSYTSEVYNPSYAPPLVWTLQKVKSDEG